MSKRASSTRDAAKAEGDEPEEEDGGKVHGPVRELLRVRDWRGRISILRHPRTARAAATHRARSRSTCVAAPHRRARRAALAQARRERWRG